MSDDRSRQLREAIQRRVLVLDGAMGTAIQSLNLGPEDFGGAELEGCNENLVLTRPELVQQIHEGYLEAGADIVETNTFGGTPLVLGEYDLSAKAHEINRQAGELARAAAERYATSDRPRFVAGSMGPTTRAISVTGGITFEQLIAEFYQQARGLRDGGVDYLLLETCQDTRNVKAGLLAINRLLAEGGRQLPVAISGTIEPMGTMLAGQGVDALYASVAHVDLLYLGLNCATGPEFMTDHIRTLAEYARFPVACVPNAGLPDEDGNYLESPAMMVEVLQRFGREGWLNLVGGCCGTTPKHIAAFAELAPALTPRTAAEHRRSLVSGVDFLEVDEDSRPIMVGERSNVIGSRKFKRLICDEKFEEASEVARAQVKGGAYIIDVCLANPDRDELADMENFLAEVIKKVRAPIMIDSTDPHVIERALTWCQGKCLINSINLEDGLERFEQVVPIGQKYGAAYVVGCIDDDPEQGMGVSRERKLAIAQRSYRILTEDFGVAPEDIYWDALVFPCGTGDEAYVGSAVETIEGIRLLKEKFPRSKSILGISNVSFGLPNAGREILNSVFLYHCVQTGLDLAIVNPEKLERYPRIPEEERRLAEDLLYNRGDDPVAAFAAHFRGRKTKPQVDRSQIPLDDRLASYIVEGTKEGLVADLELKRQEVTPLEIINGPLMTGMDEVGRLFNDNQLIVAEVLQSAEAMKAAVAHLEQFMDKADSSSRGKVILATVKGDVHDIGKNLVHIIFANNGFEVINLGIKVPPEKLIEAVREHRPDILGLSGLLVKSAQMMVATAKDLTAEGIDLPMLVGGAALSEKFVMTRIDPEYAGQAVYARDAMQGLELAKQLVDPKAFAALRQRLADEGQSKYGEGTATPKPKVAVQAGETRSPALPPVAEPPPAPDYQRHVIRNTPLDQIWSLINPRMLLGRHLGMKNTLIHKVEAAAANPDVAREFAQEEPGAWKTWEALQHLQEELRHSPLLAPRAVYHFFRCDSRGNELRLLDQRGEPIERFTFPRQPEGDRLCLADLANPTNTAPDNLCLFVTTIGENVRATADEWVARGEFLRSHLLLALAIESAEAYAELLHRQVRRMWGFPDPADLSLMDLFRGKYRGKRYSFGYPACPDLADQEKLWRLLRPEEIGCELTDGYMMDPESSVSALVFHHPDATYFNVGIPAEDLV